MALIVGHSQAKYLSHYLRDSSIRVMAYPGFRVDQLWPQIRDSVAGYDVIVVHAGANDIPRDGAEVVLERLQDLCEAIHDANTQAIVHVCGILPREQNHFPGKLLSSKFLQDFNRIALLVNKALRDGVVPLLPWLRYVDYGVVGRKHLSRDGLHLSVMGTELVARTMEEAIEETLEQLTSSQVFTERCSPARIASVDVTSEQAERGISDSEVLWA